MCTGVQNDHSPGWETDFYNNPGEPVLLDGYSDNLYSTAINTYQTRLNILYVQSEYSGIYKCSSSVSGSFVQFISTAGMVRVIIMFSMCMHYLIKT